MDECKEFHNTADSNLCTRYQNHQNVDSSCFNLLISTDNIYCMYITARCPFPPFLQMKHDQRQQLLPVTELPKLLHCPNMPQCLRMFTPISAAECSKNCLVKQGKVIHTADIT